MKTFLCSSALFIILCTSAPAQNWVESQKIAAADRNAQDSFADDVEISGNYAIVGAEGEDEDANAQGTLNGAGSAYLFEKSENGTWIQVQKLVAADRDEQDHFGRRVGISGSYAIVGADREKDDEAGNDPLQFGGSAYIFERDGGGNWNQVQKVVATDRDEDAFFGSAVAIDGDYAFIGARAEDFDADGASPLEDAGAVYIYQRDNQGGWLETQKIVAADRAPGDNFGTSLAISGHYAVIGTDANDTDASGSNFVEGAGAAYIFEKGGDGLWKQVQKIVASDRDALDNFGFDVAISGEYVIVGTEAEDEDASGQNTLEDAGSAYLFERAPNGVWNEVQKLVASDRDANDLFGIRVDIDDTYAVVGARRESEDPGGQNSVDEAGSAYVFERQSDGTWMEVQKLVASDRSEDDEFGSGVAISGTDILIGAPDDADDVNGQNQMPFAGSAYVFELESSSAYTQVSDPIELNVFPNPATGSVEVNLEVALDDAILRVKDLQGRLVGMTGINGRQSIHIHLPEAAGVYLLELQAGTRYHVARVIKF